MKKALVLFTTSVLIALSTLSLTNNVANATTAGFKAGEIMSDAVMTNASTMSVSQIQSFLNSKVSACDTYGQKLSEYGGPDLNKDGKVQRWEWGKSKYNQTKFVCLKDYKIADGRTAAAVIRDTSIKYRINPQSLIVLLQKEQGLVTDTWPLNIQYRSATGYGCPDTAPCDSQYYGLANQLDWAAKMFRSIIDQNPNWYSPYIKGYNPTVYWHPDTERCGSAPLDIKNWTTASLYSYTPYRPNQASLSAGYGTGNSCSSYGNRNFYSYFTDWFGSTQGGITAGNIEFETQPFSDKPTTVRLTIRNTSKSKISLGRIKIEAWGPTGTQYNFPSVSNLYIDPGASYTYRQTLSIPEEGMFSFNVARYYNNAWVNPPFSDYGYQDDTVVNAKLTKKPTIDQPLAVASTKQHINAPFAATFRIRNNSTTQSINIGRMKVEGHHSSGAQYDFPSTPEETTIPAGGTYPYNEQIRLSRTGNYTFRLMNFRDEYRWSSTFPESTDASIARSINVTVGDAVTLVSPLTFSTSSSHVGSPITASFSIKNFSDKSVDIGRMKIEGRLSNGEQYDLPSTDTHTVISPGATLNYSEIVKLPKAGNYTFRLMNFRDAYRWSATYPENESTNIARSAGVNVKDSVTVTSPLAISETNTHANTQLTATFSMKNFGDKPVNIGRMKVEGRLSNGQQYDFPSTPDDLTIQPGATYTYSGSRSLSSPGAYTFRLMNFRDAYRWSATYPQSETSSVTRSVPVTVKDAVTVIEPLQLSASSINANGTVTATFKLKNFGATAVNIGRMKVEGHLSTGGQYDFPSTINGLTIQPGATYLYSEALTIPKKGSYTFRLMNFRDAYRWSATYPQSESPTITRTASLNAY